MNWFQQAYKMQTNTILGTVLELDIVGNWSYLDFSFRHAKINQSYAPYSTGNSDFDGNGTIDAPSPLVNQVRFTKALPLLGFKFGAIHSYSYGGFN